jgi:hypothetical protein
MDPNDMRQRVLSLIVLTLIITPLIAQTPSAKQTAKQSSAAELERQQLRQQAYETVKAVWANSRDITDTRHRNDINLQAFRLVWGTEPDLARNELTKYFDELLAVYSSTGKEDKGREPIETALSRTISAMAAGDPVAALKLQQRYFEARRQVTGDRTDDRRDRAGMLNLASDLLDTDVAQSVQLASKVVEKAFPEYVIQYLFNLQRKEPRMAQQLYETALRLLASGRHYSPRSAISISVYAFNEGQLLTPIVWSGTDGKQNLSLTFTANSYERSRNAVDRELARAFINAAYQHLQVRVLQDSGADRSDLMALYSNYFLEQKIKAYAQLYGLDPEAQWVRFETAVTALARQAGATDTDLAMLGDGALKLSRQQSAITDADDEKALTLAADEKDPRKKARLIVNGIMWLLRQKRFTAAEQSVDLLEDLKMRNQVAQVVKVAIAKDAIESRRWSEVPQRVEKIDDRSMKIYLLLEAARASSANQSERETALQFLNAAHKSLEALDGIQKAAGAVAALALTQTLDPTYADIALNEVSKTINNTEKYQGEKYFAVLPLPPNNREFGYQLKEIGFEDCFARSGKQDWLRADLAGRNLQNRYLQAWARLTAAKAFIETAGLKQKTSVSKRP